MNNVLGNLFLQVIFGFAHLIYDYISCKTATSLGQSRP